MDVLALRLVHIGAGAFWAGSVYAFLLFVQPAAAKVAPSSTPFLYELLNGRRFSAIILASAATTVAAGLYLLWRTSNGFDPDLLFGIGRLGYTVGGTAGVLTFAIGGGYVFPRTLTVERTIGAILTDGRPPTAEEQALLARTARESRRAGWFVLAGLAIAVLSMATAQYWSLLVP
jgi:hypothetical protein